MPLLVYGFESMLIFENMDDIAWRMFSGLVLGMFFLIMGLLFLKVNEIQSGPYMDEVFHVPQAQKYCDGNLTEWDPMITTLPGLYLVSAALLKPLDFLVPTKSNSSFCSTFWLRSINFLFAAGNLGLLYLLDIKLNAGNKTIFPAALMTALTLALFPLLYFFTFLYYTDSGSTFFVLLMYLLHQHRRPLAAASAGATAIVFRQTNVVWVAFFAGLSSIEILKRFTEDTKDSSKDDFHLLKAALARLSSSIKHDRGVLKHLALDVLKEVVPYVFVMFGFVVFVFVNGSIVVGAKQDHEAGLHLPQIFYFSVFVCVFSFMHVLSPQTATSFWNLVKRRPFLVFAVVVLCEVAVGRYTVAHRYLLADNRHYTFYLWGRIFQRHPLVKYALVPGYVVAIWAAMVSLERGFLWKAVYCVCVSATLLPASLVEFRYFIIPYLIYRLNVSRVTYLKLAMESIVYVVVNVATVYLFLKKPFYWDGDPSPQRFMW